MLSGKDLQTKLDAIEIKVLDRLIDMKPPAKDEFIEVFALLRECATTLNQLHQNNIQLQRNAKGNLEEVKRLKHLTGE